MILKGNGFILRRLRLSDAKELFRCQQDPEAKINFMTTPKKIGELKKDINKDIRQYYLGKTKRSSDNFVIDIDGGAIGTIGIHDITYGHEATSSSLVSKKFRDQGIGTAAHKLLIKYAFKTYKLRRLQGNVRTFNKASARMLEKSGYKLEGILRKNKFKDGIFMDDMVWAVVR